MASRATVDLLTVALELRLAAHEAGFASQRLTDARLMEMADILEGIAHREVASNQNAQVRPLPALSRRASSHRGSF